MPRTVVTFGTYDLLHIGHVRLLERAASYGSRLVVGVSSDRLNMEKKGVLPIVPQWDRMALVAALRSVDEVFLEESLELKDAYIKKFEARVLVMGDDWRGKFDVFRSLCEVVYLRRTPGVSTTDIRHAIENRKLGFSDGRHLVTPSEVLSTQIGSRSEPLTR